MKELKKGNKIISKNVIISEGVRNLMGEQFHYSTSINNMIHAYLNGDFGRISKSVENNNLKNFELNTGLVNAEYTLDNYIVKIDTNLDDSVTTLSLYGE